MSPPLRRRIRVGLCAVLSLALAGQLAAQCNAPPVAVADAASTADNQTLLIDVLANDSDPDGDPLGVDIESSTCAGTVAAGAFGLLAYEPDPVAAPVTCEIGYRAHDGTTSSPIAVVAVTVRASGMIFADGFESGDLSAWDEAVP